MLAILALRRIPSLLILYKLMPEVSNWREALFCGHFGPVSPSQSRALPYLKHPLFQIGVGAVFICTLAQTRIEAPRNPPSSQQDLLATALQPIVSFVVLGSILIRMSTRFRSEDACSCLHRCRWPFYSILFRRAPYPDDVSLTGRRST